MKKRYTHRTDSIFALAEDIFSDGPFVELRGREEISIQGCRKILVCTENEVQILLRSAKMLIEGEDLRCTTYFAGAVSVRGRICALRFDETN